MNGSRFAIGGGFAAAFALALCAVTLVPRGVAGNEPIYQLDAAYHHLPAKLVAELLAHPPVRAPLAPYVHCETSDIDGESVSYCICFDREACAHAPNIYSVQREWSGEQWTCTGPVGAIGIGGMGVCRAEEMRTIIVG